jgi:DNA polymerase zeta
MTISVRIVNTDHYMAKPGPLDRSYSPFSKKLSKVPVIRIFGSTLAGQKVCLHIHQVRNYILKETFFPF